MVNFEKYAQNYYNEIWVKSDEPFRRIVVTSATTEKKLTALERSLKCYILPRVLWRKYDVWNIPARPRYKPVLDAFENAQHLKLEVGASTREVAEAVYEFEKMLRASYKEPRNVSAASKLMWLKFRRPFIIYDGNACTFLGASPNLDRLREYYDKWRAEYARHEDEIKRISKKFIDEPWFQERIFDNYIWTEGGKMKSTSADNPAPPHLGARSS